MTGPESTGKPKKKLKRWHKIVLGVVGVFIVLGIIGALAGGGDDDGDQAGNEPRREQPAGSTTTERQPAPAAEKPAADDGDTGRMSQTEWEQARDAIFDVNGELRDYRQQVSERCSLMVQAMQVAEALDCIDDAYSGVEDKMALAYADLDDLQGDVAKKCLRAVEIATNVVNTPLFQAAAASHRELASLDGDRITAGLAELNTQSARWGTASGNVLQLCAPE
jgi:hypothetical protein